MGAVTHAPAPAQTDEDVLAPTTFAIAIPTLVACKADSKRYFGDNNFSANV